LAATGTNQIFKQLGKKDGEDDKKDKEGKSGDDNERGGEQ
jgi:hypothetical protein